MGRATDRRRWTVSAHGRLTNASRLPEPMPLAADAPEQKGALRESLTVTQRFCRLPLQAACAKLAVSWDIV